MAYKVSFVGFSFSGRSIFKQLPAKDNLILRIIGEITSQPVELSSTHDADLVLVYPYVQWERAFKIRSKLAVKLMKYGVIPLEEVLRISLGIKQKRAIVICPENLDRCHWERFGWMLRVSNFPRLTFWPDGLDTAGKRYPYWYNYVQWPEFPRDPNCYERFGELYDLEKLMQPLPDEKREARAVCISSHDQFPRAEILSRIQEIISVDVYGKGGMKFEGSKLEIMRKYKYCLTPENSLGFGYCTEKLPESWVAGCIPVGVYPQAFTDFNSEALLWDDIFSTKPMEQPLLNQRPDLSNIVNYIADVINHS